MATSEFSLLEVLAFQPNLAWPWQVAGDVLGTGGLALVVWGGARAGVGVAISRLTPAWLVVYTIGVLLLTRPPVSPVVLPLPLVLALAGSWCLATELQEQIGLLVSGAVGGWLLWPRRSGPSAGMPVQRGASPLERGWRLDLPDEPCRATRRSASRQGSDARVLRQGCENGSTPRERSSLHSHRCWARPPWPRPR